MLCFVYAKFEAPLRQTFGDVTYKLPKVTFNLCSWLATQVSSSMEMELWRHQL